MSLRNVSERPATSLGTPARGFRTDIQALRAVAVGIVVVFHVWPGALPGGYVGVDVFFVISGFLITGHLLGEVARTGTVSLAAFWGRRIRRLLPAAFVVLAACLAITFIALPSTRWEQTFIEIAASALYAENWLLAGNSIDYLAASNLPTLVQHFWSLSTEEQFYIAWPLLILAGLALARLARRITRVDHRIVTAVVLGIIFVASLAFSISFTRESPSEAYFSTFTRAWEFAAGGLLAALPVALSSGLTGVIATHLRSIAGWVGLGAIAVAAVRFSGETEFPGSRALFPVLGAAAVIWAGSASTGWGPAALSRFAPLQFLGGVSYSLYLWHWPIIVTAGIVFTTDRGIVDGLAVVALATVLAWLTRRFVEDPVRFQSFWKKRKRYAFAFAAASMAVIVGVAGISVATMRSSQAAQIAALDTQLNSPDPSSCIGASAAANQPRCSDAFAVPVSIDPLFAQGDTPQIECTASLYSAKIRSCDFGDTSRPSGRVALVGDSHAGAILAPLDRIGSERNLEISTYIKQGCAGLDPVPVASRDSVRLATFCADWSENVIDTIVADDEIDTVVVTYASNARAYYRDMNSTRVVATLTRLTDAGKNVLFVLDAPSTGGRKIPTCLAESGRTLDCASPRPEVTKSSQRDAELVEGLSGVSTIALEDFMCNDATCFPVVGGVIAYFDADHLTNSFARTLEPFIGQALDRARG